MRTDRRRILIMSLLGSLGCDKQGGELSDTGAEGDETSQTATSTTSETSTGVNTGTTTTGDPAGCPGPAVSGDPCQADEDCEIAGDCCGCFAYNPMFGSPGNCGGPCEQDQCAAQGITEAICDQGACVAETPSCNASLVTCGDPPPSCDAAALPTVAKGCWTGDCLEVQSCDWVPDCSHCPAETICVVTRSTDCDHHRCEPPVPECDGAAPCECHGAIYCTSPTTTCAVEGDAVVCS